jgi:hypothetical protein
MRRTLSFIKHAGQLSALLLLTVPLPAHAYLDPGTGSTIIQVVIAGLATGGYLLKTYWRQVKHGVSQLINRTQQTTDDRER